MSAGPVLQPGDGCTNCGKGTITRAAPIFDPSEASFQDPNVATGPHKWTQYDCTHCGTWREPYPPPQPPGGAPGGSRRV